MILDEKTYLFNPFQLPKLSDEAIEKEVENLISKFIVEAEAPTEISNNIEVYSNLNYFYGEMLARYTKRHAIKKYLNDKGEDLLAYKLRKDWLKNALEKAPAYSYFEAQAKDKFELSRIEEFELLEWKSRFKNAYESTEGKANALKRTLDATKYEIGIN